MKLAKKDIGKYLDSNIQTIREYLEKGMSVNEIRKLFDYSYSAIYNAIQRNNMGHLVSCIRGAKSETAKQYHQSKSRFTEKMLIEEYIINRENLYSIAKKYNCTPANVLAYMRKYSIPTRNKSEASSLCYEKNGDELREKHRQNAYAGRTGIHMKGRRRRNSWIEQKFEKYCIENGIEYEREYQINGSGHHYDFLVKLVKNYILIELDGNYWHNTEKQKNLDIIHENIALQNGYNVLRFTDSQIKKTKGKCFDELRKYDNGRVDCSRS